MPKFVTRAAYYGDTIYPGATAKPQRGQLYDALQSAGVLTGANRATVTATATLTLDQCGPLVVDASGGDIELTLPASGTAGDEAAYDVIRIDGSANSLTLLPAGSDTVATLADFKVAPNSTAQIKLPAGFTDWHLLAVSAHSPASQTFTRATTTGTAPAYVATLVPAITGPKELDLVIHADTLSGASTLAANGDSAKGVKQYNNSGAKVDAVMVTGMQAKLVDDGTHWVLMNPLPVGVQQFMHLQDIKAQNTAGGASLSGANTRVLNTVTRNTITGGSLASNQVTLPAGTFRVHGVCQAYACDYVRAYLWNITTGAIALSGAQSLAYAANAGTAQPSFFGEIVLTGTTVFEFRMFASTARATNGLGEALNSAIFGNECYVNLEIERVA